MFLEQKPSNSALFFVPFLRSSSPRKVGVRDRCVSVNELLFKKEACNAVLKRHLPGMERKGWRIENARCKRIRQWLSKETNPNNPTSSLWLVFSASALHIIICLNAICPTWYFKHPPPEKLWTKGVRKMRAESICIFSKADKQCSAYASFLFGSGAWCWSFLFSVWIIAIFLASWKSKNFDLKDWLEGKSCCEKKSCCLVLLFSTFCP